MVSDGGLNEAGDSNGVLVVVLDQRVVICFLFESPWWKSERLIVWKHHVEPGGCEGVEDFT